jgi:TetR/AcrR family transcriptional regulator, fatty acid metabolism regulator protein
MLSDQAGLLAAAEAVFAERGYHGSSIRDIARRAGFSVGGIYQFFPSKDDLYLAVLDEGWLRLKADLGLALRARRSLAQLSALTQVLVDNYQSHRGLWQILTGEQAAFPAAFKQHLLKRLTSHLRHMRRLVADIMRQGVEEGVFPAAEVELLTSAYGGIIRQCFDDAMMLGTPVPPPDAMLAVFLNGATRPGSRR